MSKRFLFCSAKCAEFNRSHNHLAVVGNPSYACDYCGKTFRGTRVYDDKGIERKLPQTRRKEGSR